jgi:hypothetical protein
MTFLLCCEAQGLIPRPLGRFNAFRIPHPLAARQFIQWTGIFNVAVLHYPICYTPVYPGYPVYQGIKSFFT